MVSFTISWEVPPEGLTKQKLLQLDEAVNEAIGKVLGKPPIASANPSTLDVAEGVSTEGWSPATFRAFLQRLRDDGATAQADVMEHAVANEGTIDRATVYQVAEWDPRSRSLKGFTRPINRIVEEMRKECLLGPGIRRPLMPIYGTTRKGYQRAKSFSVPADLLPVFGTKE